METSGSYPIETDRLLLRRFTPEDWRDLQEMVLANEHQPFAECDVQWPTDDLGIQAACSYFSQQSSCLAVELKPGHKVIGFIHAAPLDSERSLDVGHIFHCAYVGNSYEYEALRALFSRYFDAPDIDSISAFWPLSDVQKLEPLLALGMKIVQTAMSNKFRPEPDGTTAQFEGCQLQITRAEWLARQPS
mgnify:CR=1 FL=1